MGGPRSKRVGIGARPPRIRTPRRGFAEGDADALNKGDLYTARLTLDVTPALRAHQDRLRRGVTVAELLRGLLEREFPDKRTENLP